MGEEVPSVAMEQAQVDVGIVDFVARLAIADLEVDHVAVRAIDELMGIGPARGKARHHARRQTLGPGVGHQLHLAFDDIDELILGAVPVALGGGRARRQAHQIDDEMAEAESVAQSALLPPHDRLAIGGRIAAAAPGFDAQRIKGNCGAFADVAHGILPQGPLRRRPPPGRPPRPAGRPTFFPPNPPPVTRPAVPAVERGRGAAESETPRSMASSRRISSRMRAASSNSRSAAAWRIFFSRSAMVAWRLCPRRWASPVTPVSTVTRSRS